MQKVFRDSIYMAIDSRVSKCVWCTFLLIHECIYSDIWREKRESSNGSSNRTVKWSRVGERERERVGESWRE